MIWNHAKFFRHQLVIFVFVGMIAVGVDALSFELLYYISGSESLSKGVSFVLGSIAAYYLNKHFTFRYPSKAVLEKVRFSILYSASLGANVAVHYMIFSDPSTRWLAFFAATATSTCMNFLGMKYWVFR